MNYPSGDPLKQGLWWVIIISTVFALPFVWAYERISGNRI